MKVNIFQRIASWYGGVGLVLAGYFLAPIFFPPATPYLIGAGLALIIVALTGKKKK